MAFSLFVLALLPINANADGYVGEVLEPVFDSDMASLNRTLVQAAQVEQYSTDAEYALEEKLLSDINKLLNGGFSDDLEQAVLSGSQGIEGVPDVMSLSNVEDSEFIDDFYVEEISIDQDIHKLEEYLVKMEMADNVMEISVDAVAGAENMHVSYIASVDEIGSLNAISPAAGVSNVSVVDSIALADSVAIVEPIIVVDSVVEPVIVVDSVAIVEPVEKEKPAIIQSIDDQINSYFKTIPANGITLNRAKFVAKNDVAMERGAQNSIFNDNSSGDINIRKAVGLEISIKTGGTKEFQYMNAAYDALSLGHFEASIENYHKVIDLNPENTDGLFGLATAYHGLGQFDDAKEWYVKVLNIDYKHMQALNNLLVLISESSPQKGLKQLYGLQKTNPEHAAIPAQIGLIHMGQQQYDLAVQSLKRAVVLEPSNLDYRYNLALLIEHLGAYDDAKKIYYSILTELMKGSQLAVTRREVLNRISEIGQKRLSSR